jgi:hypothetical protein
VGSYGGYHTSSITDEGHVTRHSAYGKTCGESKSLNNHVPDVNAQLDLGILISNGGVIGTKSEKTHGFKVMRKVVR